MTVDIRLNGTRRDIGDILFRLRTVLTVTSVSDFHLNRQEPGTYRLDITVHRPNP